MEYTMRVYWNGVGTMIAAVEVAPLEAVNATPPIVEDANFQVKQFGAAIVCGVVVPITLLSMRKLRNQSMPSFEYSGHAMRMDAGEEPVKFVKGVATSDFAVFPP